ncbi:hypothetical protein B0J12DRAFT_668528 [Macrophomina phaseolina]|uniref:Kynurenine formamidase n=1 Tax=Macrophomina phaseolina TaxID=35725 RepID=A0ABQ8G789_9PEZI|nr:hypothetical protein B0J12DRAFT_668528 [Macrophomina phaseolina]
MTNATSSYPLYIKGLPYGTASRLQTLDVCLPRPLSESPADAIWVVYIHGGAWRDPLVTSSALSPALTHLLSSSSSASVSSSSASVSSSSSSSPPTRPLAHIAGFASLNYRLSPYPQHPTHPSLAPTTSIPARHAGRNVTHPTHVDDVAAALRWLRREYGVGGTAADGGKARDWAVVGHSCGATLAWQLLDGWLESADERDRVAAPVGVVGLCGLYNLPLLAENHADVAAYEEFLQSAFGGDESVWLRASPTQMGARFGPEKWRAGRVVVLGASPDDQLVEGMQRDVMVRALEERGWVSGEGRDGRELVLLELEGLHDDCWKEGKGVAKAVECVVGRLFGVGKEGGFF